MSNNLMNYEPRTTRRKAKAAKQIEQENTYPTPVKTHSESSIVRSEAEPELENKQIKRVKTENNSASKNAISIPSNYNIKYFQDSLSFLKKCAADNESL